MKHYKCYNTKLYWLFDQTLYFSGPTNSLLTICMISEAIVDDNFVSTYGGAQTVSIIGSTI